MIKILHNPKCSKSREACQFMKKKGLVFETTEYLKTPPDQKQIKALLKLLGLKAEDIVRKKESLFKNEFAGKKLTETQWIKILSENPVLIERPIIVKDNKAVIGRPTEKILELL